MTHWFISFTFAAAGNPSVMFSGYTFWSGKLRRTTFPAVEKQIREQLKAKGVDMDTADIININSVSKLDPE